MSVTFRPGLVRIIDQGTVFERRLDDFFINGTNVPLEQMPLQVRYLMALRASGEALL